MSEAGYLLLGRWDDRELALATLVLVFTLRALFSCLKTPRSPSR